MAETSSTPGGFPWRAVLGAVATAAVVFAGLVVWNARWPSGGPAESVVEHPALPAEMAPAAPAETPTAGGTVESGGRLQLDSKAFQAGRPVVLDLVLGEPSRGSDPRPVRILSVDQRILETTASLGIGAHVNLEIDPAFLTPGLYMIEVETTEQNHFPIRRYVLEVR